MPDSSLVPDDVLEQTRCLDISPSNACNARCLFCSQDDGDREMGRLDPAATARHIYWAFRNGYRRLGLSGGEPTLLPELPRLIRFARKVGFHSIRLQTNGIRLADASYAQRLVEAGLSTVRFSVHGHEAGLHDGLVGIPGAFKSALSAIGNMRRLRCRLGLNIVLNADNHAFLPEFFELFLRRLEITNFMVIYPLYDGNMGREADRMGFRLSEALPSLEKAFRLFEEEGLEPPLLLHFTPCLLPGYESRMLGWYRFEARVVEPDGRGKDLDEAVRSRKLRPSSCEGCAYRPRCPGVDRGYLDRYGAAEFRPLAQRAHARTRPPSDDPRRRILTENERCVLGILSTGPRPTDDLLSAAVDTPLCQDCRGGPAVLQAAERLARMGRIRRSWSGGKYLWTPRT
ncbi:MAG: radical SAM protein [Elusimicrobiota bacterium]